MSRPSVVVYGPQGSGKTRNAQAILRHFGLEKVMDGVDPESESIPREGALILTNLRPSLTVTKANRKILVYRIEWIKRALGASWQDPTVPPA